MENGKRLLIAFLPLLQHSNTPLLQKEALRNTYKGGEKMADKVSIYGKSS